MSDTLEQSLNIFEERAENLSREELLSWSATMPSEKDILRKLQGTGAKLLIGPRGCGKSTYIRRAYFEMLDGEEVFPIYVNYARSLALEPFFHRRANALQVFQQWLIAKIIEGAAITVKDSGLSIPASLSRRADWAQRFIRQLEVGETPIVEETAIAPSQLLFLLEDWTTRLDRIRCVLLLDDAAHAFSVEQQREFFEVFRAMKSRHVAAKAAVYPGITSYSPNFHIGHEAELVHAWCNPHDPSYTRLMRDLLRKRLPQILVSQLEAKTDLIDYLAFASFGLPRAFLNMVAQLVGVDEDNPSRPTKPLADTAVSNYAQSVRAVFESLSGKLPRYKHFITVGRKLESSIIGQIRTFNTTHDIHMKAVSIAIADPMSPEISRILAFMEYAGMVRKGETFSRGNRGIYQRYTVHYALLIDEKALVVGKSNSAANIAEVISTRDAHAIPHTKQNGLLDVNELQKCTINLEPCPNCGTARASSEARFCVRCGTELKESSIYEELLKTPIDRLPLTRRKITGLKADSTIRTVKDILLDEESKEIRKVTGVGPVWAKRIHTAAEEFVSV